MKKTSQRILTVVILMFAALIEMNLKQVDHALVLCDKMTDMRCRKWRSERIV